MEISQLKIEIAFILQQTTKKNLNYKPEGRKNIGKPLTRWEDDFREEGTGLIVDDDDDDDDNNIILLKYLLFISVKYL